MEETTTPIISLSRVGEVAGVRVEQGSLEVQEADVLGCVQRQDLEQVVDKAPVLLHGLHVLVKDGIFLVGHLIAVGFSSRESCSSNSSAIVRSSCKNKLVS